MINILLVSHGKLAEGMYDTLGLFFGDLKDVDYLCLKPDQNPDSFKEEIAAKLAAFSSKKTIIISDIMGGTPFNQSAYFVSKDVLVLSGLNLALLLDLMTKREGDIDVDSALNAGKESLTCLNKMMGVE